MLSVLISVFCHWILSSSSMIDSRSYVRSSYKKRDALSMQIENHPILLWSALMTDLRRCQSSHDAFFFTLLLLHLRHMIRILTERTGKKSKYRRQYTWIAIIWVLLQWNILLVFIWRVINMSVPCKCNREIKFCLQYSFTWAWDVSCWPTKLHFSYSIRILVLL